MNRRRIIIWLTLAVAAICLGVFAWANTPVVSPNPPEIVGNAEQLFAAVSNAPTDGTPYEIAVSDNTIISPDAALVISAGKNIKLTVSGGSSLDFSNTGDNGITILNGAHLAVDGSGDLVKRTNRCIIHCGYDSSLDVTGVTLTISDDSGYLSGIDTESAPSGSNPSGSITVRNAKINAKYYAIHAEGFGNVTVTNSTLSGEIFYAAGGNELDAYNYSLTVANSTVNANGRQWAIDDVFAGNVFVTNSTIIGGTQAAIQVGNYGVAAYVTNSFISADVSGKALLALLGAYLCVHSCDCRGELNPSPIASQNELYIYSGTFNVNPNAYVAPCCYATGSSLSYTVNNKLSLILGKGDVTTSGDEYKCTVGDGPLVISADLTSGDERAFTALDALNAIDKAALPKSLEVTMSADTQTITVTNNGCPEGTYKVTIMAEKYSPLYEIYGAFRVLNITVSPTAIVSTCASLDEALKSDTINLISLSDDIENFASFDNLGCAKSLNLNGKMLTLAESADIAESKDLNRNLIVYNGTISGDIVFGATSTGKKLTISGDNMKVNGKAFGANGGFTSADVTIVNGAQFSDIDGIADKLQDKQYITSVKDSKGYYTVKALSNLQKDITNSNDLTDALYLSKINSIKIANEITGQVSTDVNLNGTSVKSLDLNANSVDNACLNITNGVTLEIKDTSSVGGGNMTAVSPNVLFTLASNSAVLSIDKGTFYADVNKYFDGIYSGGSGGNVKMANGVRFKASSLSELSENLGSVLSGDQMFKQVGSEMWEVVAKSTTGNATAESKYDLEAAIRDKNVKNITISDDIPDASGFTLSSDTGSKKISVSNDKTLSLDSGIVIKNGTSLDITGGTVRVSGDSVLFTVEAGGELIIGAGKYIASSADKYISADETATVTIKDGAKFFGTYDELSDIRDLLADDQILVQGDDGYCTVTKLSGEITVSNPEQLKKALEAPAVTTVTLSNNYTGKVSGDITLSGDKTLKLNGKELSADTYTIIVPTGTSLYLNADAENSKITANAKIFSVEGTGHLTISGTMNGKYETTGTVLFELSADSVFSIDKGIFKAAGGVYFSGDGSSNVKIASHVKFYGATEPENVKNVLQDTQMLKPVTIDGEQYWEVILKSESPDATVGTSADIDLAVRNNNVKNISLSNDIADAKGFTVSTNTGSKTIDLDTHTLSLDSGITITGAVSLDILDGGTLARTTDGYLFTIDDEANLILESGKFYSPSGQYITGGSKENVTIKEGAQFYFGTDGTKASEFEKTYLADGLKLEKDGDTGWYKVVKSGGTGGSGGGGGCNAGFTFLALAALAFVSARSEKK